MTTLIECPIQVKEVSEWLPVSKIPTFGSSEERAMVERYGQTGVYQVAHVEDLDNINEHIIHESIGYTGKSITLFNRTYGIRAPKGSHGVNRHIKQNGWSKDTEVFIRYLFPTNPEDYTALEDWIHTNTKNMYGYTFAWRQSSEGTDGSYSKAQDMLEQLSYHELLNLGPFIKSLLQDKGKKYIDDEIKQKFMI
jgi:hypothetical protein